MQKKTHVIHMDFWRNARIHSLVTFFRQVFFFCRSKANNMVYTTFTRRQKTYFHVIVSGQVVLLSYNKLSKKIYRWFLSLSLSLSPHLWIKSIKILRNFSSTILQLRTKSSTVNIKWNKQIISYFSDRKSNANLCNHFLCRAFD